MPLHPSENNSPVVYTERVQPWSIRATLVGDEYRDDILGSIDGIVDETCEITDVSFPDDSLFLEIFITPVRKKVTPYHCAMLASRWTAVYAEALEDVELLGLVDDTAVQVPRPRHRSGGTPNSVSASDVASPPLTASSAAGVTSSTTVVDPIPPMSPSDHAVAERAAKRQAVDLEATISRLPGGPSQHEQPRKQLKTRIPLHTHIVNRDGGKCFNCDGPLHAHSMKAVFAFPQLDIDNNEYSRFTHSTGAIANVGICYFCTQARIKSFDHSLAASMADPAWRARYSAHLDRIASRLSPVPSPDHARVCRLLETTRQLMQQTADADDAQRAAAIEEAATTFTAADAPARLAHYTRKVQKLLDRDGTTTCAWCDRPFRADNIPTVDHVVPKSYGGTKDPRNLITVCSSCNHTRGNKTITEWLNYCHKQHWTPHFENLALRLNDMADDGGAVGDFAKNDLHALIADRLNSATPSASDTKASV